MIRDADNDADRMALYPNLDYKGLFNAISQLVDSAPHLQYGIQGKSHCLTELVMVICFYCEIPILLLSDSGSNSNNQRG